MSTANTQNRVLLPLGCSHIFYAADEGAAKLESANRKLVTFGFHGDALVHLIGEFISQGAVGITVDPFSGFAGHLEQLPHPFRTRVSVVDQDKTTQGLATQIFAPIAEEFGFDPNWVEVIGDPIAGPQRRLLEIEDSVRKNQFAKLLYGYNFTYHFLLGIRHQLQIDIPIGDFRTVLGNLRSAVRGGEAAAHLAFLEGAISSYKDCSIGAIEVARSVATEAQKANFELYLADEEYKRYSELKYSLGIRERATSAVRRLWEQTQALLRRRVLKSVLNYGVRVASVSTGIPLPTVDMGDAPTRYSPPIVQLRSAISAARRRWLALAPGLAPMKFNYPSFQNLEYRLFSERKNGSIAVESGWFRSLYSSIDGPYETVEDPDVQAIFLRFFATNLNPAYTCPTHRDTISINDVQVSWSDVTIQFDVSGCCEESIKGALAQMCAYDSTKSYDYSFPMYSTATA